MEATLFVCHLIIILSKSNLPFFLKNYISSIVGSLATDLGEGSQEPRRVETGNISLQGWVNGQSNQAIIDRSKRLHRGHQYLLKQNYAAIFIVDGRLTARSYKCCTHWPYKCFCIVFFSLSLH